MSKKRVAVIGAGVGGLTAVKSLLEVGLHPVAFEKGSQIGGVWRYDENLPTGGGIAYRGLKTNTSRRMLAFSDFPFNSSQVDFPSQAEVIAYLEAYADHFGLRPFIQFNTTVEQIRQQTNGRWQLTTKSSDGIVTTEEFEALMVASGLYQEPMLPELPGLEQFEGEVSHSLDYKGPEAFAGQRVVVVGAGSSAADIASEVSETAVSVDISSRSGVWFLPHYDDKKQPADYNISRMFKRVPDALVEFVFTKRLHKAYQVMGFTSQQIETVLHPPPLDLQRGRLTPGGHILQQLLNGTVRLKPAIARLESNRVTYVDGTYTSVDSVIMATGYHLRFPFLSDEVIKVEGQGTVKLYKQVFRPHYPNLAFLGMCNVVGPVFPLIEMQARWAAHIFAGQVTLPSSIKQVQAIERHFQQHQKQDISPMGVSYALYMDDLAAELKVVPRLWRHPQLLSKLLTGPLLAAQYRLDGSGKSEKARQIILGHD